MHDLGRVAVPVRIWQKPGPLTADEWERVRLHPYFTERVLNHSSFLSELAPVASWQWPSVATAARYFELNTGWEPQPLETTTRLRAYRLPDPRVEPTFESFAPFGDDIGS